MKQEAGKKKSKLWLWLVIGAVALLAVAGVVLALVLGGGGETGPKGGRPELYWNIDRKAYTENSESGLSTREPGEDGSFKVRFAINGEIVEYAVADKQLINYIDTLDAMGLVKDSDGTVVDVIDPKDIAKEVNKNAYVKSATANKIVANTSVAMNGMNINVKLEDGITEIYDVTPQAEVPGQKITTSDLRPMDTLVIYANDLDQVTHVYVNGHSKESKVYWRADQFYSSADKSTTRVPDENGAYTIPFFCEGEVVELKTKDKTIATKIDSVSRWKCHFGFTFDEEGYIIEQYASAIGIQGVMIADCWDIVEIDGDTYTLQRLTTNDGSTWTGTIPAGTTIYESGVKAKREGQGGRKIDSLQMGDRVTVWTDTNGQVVLVYVSERLVDSPAYWSPTRKYSSAKGETTRVIGPSGYYEIELYKEGSNKKETYYVKDKETMSYMDSITAKIMALKVLPGNIVEYAYNEETLTGYTTATRGGVVTAVTGGIFTKMTYGKRGTESNMVLAANARVWNVSGYGEYGEATTVQPGDHIYAVRQPTGEILLGFITKRTIGAEKLYWNTELLWDKTNKTSTRVPDEEGWYHFTMAHMGKQVELKTKDKKLVDKIDGLSIGATGLDVSGGVIYNVYDAGYPYGGNKVASGYKFQYVTSEGKYYCEYASDAKKTVEFVMAEDCVIYNVSNVFNEFKGERIYSIPYNAMLTVFCDIYGEAKVVYVRSQSVKDMYWKTEILYDSSKKVTKRVPDADGYYWYTLAVNGECKTFKTKDQKIANSMDSYAGAFGLNVRGDEIIGFVTTANVLNVSGNGFTTASVVAINGRTITVEVSGKNETMKLSSDCKIYDVSPVAEKFGQVATLKVGDIVRTYLNKDKTEHNYVYIKSRLARVKGEVGYCEACKAEVKWKPMDGSSAPSVSTSTHWYVPANMTAWVQSSFVTTSKDYTICLDMNGKVLTRAENGRMFRVAEGETLNIVDSVGGGKIVAGGGNNFSGGVILMSAGGTINMYGGTIEYVQGDYKPSYGGVVNMSGKGTTFNLYNGTITGGISYAQGEKHGYGGNFYVASGATLNMYGGEISNGKVYGALKVTEKNGTTTYSTLAPYGGNIYMTESSMVNILGGVVKDGHAVRETFTYTENGEEKTLTNMSYGGNIYKVNTQKLNGMLYIENATISGGEAHRGGNINAYSSGGATPKIEDPNYDPEGPNQGGIVVLNKATIIDGTASQYGGNIMSNCATWAVTDSKILNGSSGANGGNIYSQGGIYTVLGTTISGGKATDGGNIYLYKNKNDANAFAIAEGTVVENGVATSEGGNIYVKNKNYVIDADGKIISLESTPGAVGVAMLPTLGILGGEIKGGEAPSGENIYSAGHLYIEGGFITDGEVYFTGGKEASIELCGGEIADKFTVKNPLEIIVTGEPKTADLTLDKNVKLTVGELTENAKIKVTTHHESPVFTNGFENAQAYVDAGYIAGAEEGSTITVTADNELSLVGAPPETKLIYCEHCKQEVAFTEWTYGSGSYTKESGHFYLVADETISANHRIGGSSSDKAADGVDVVIDLNGHNITSSGPVFYVYPYSTLTVQDSVGTSVVTGKGTLRSSKPGDGGVFYAEGANSKLNIYGGTFTLLDTDKVRNGGVIFAGGTTKIYGGTFNGNTVTDNGTAFCCGGTLEINGGTINGVVFAKDGASVTLSGAPYVETLEIVAGDLLKLKELTTGAEIFVSTNKSAYITDALTNANDYLAYIKPAATGWTVENRDGKLLLTNGVDEPAEPFDPNKVYEKAVAMNFSGADADGKVTAKCPVCGEEVEWNILPANTSGKSFTTLETGHYYLSESVDYTQNNGLYSFTGGKQICINLNGQSITTTKRAFYTETTSTTLNIMGEGIISGPGELSGTNIRGVLDLTSNTNLYGGTYISTRAEYPAIENRKSTSGNAVLSIYAGTTIINEADGIAVNLKSKGALAIYGGTITGKVVDDGTTGITVSGAPVINALDLTNGKKITVGELTDGADITVLANGVFTNDFANAKAYLDAEYFVSGNEEFKLAVEGNALSVAAPITDGSDIYEAAKAMDFSAGGTVTALCPACGVECDWLPLTAANADNIVNPTAPATNKRFDILPKGDHYHFYLDANTDYTQNVGYYNISGNTQVCLNLNGQTLESAARVFYTETDGTALTIMGDGTVRGVGTGAANRGVLDMTRELNLYGGTYESKDAVSPVVTARGSSALCKVNIYAGTTIRRAEGFAGLCVYITDNGTVNLYGGSIIGGDTSANDDVFGGNIWVFANTSSARACTLNVYGGTISGGVDAKGGNIYVTGNTNANASATVNISGGKIVGGGVYATGANASVNISGDAVVDYLETEGANLVNVGELTEGADIVADAAHGVVFTNAVTGDVAKYFRGNTNRAAGYVVDNAIAIANICPHCGKTFDEIQWTEIGEIGANYRFTASGHYKLTQDVSNTSSNIFTFDAAAKLSEGLDVVLDACGYRITSVGRGLYINKYNMMTIFDSVGGAEIHSVSATAALGGSGVYIHDGAVLNFYDLAVYGSEKAHGNGNALSSYGSNAVVNIYSGEFYGNDDPDKAGKLGGVIYNRAGVMNIYGGYFDSAVLADDAKGDCVYNNKTLNIYGGVFDGEIYTEAGATTTVAEDLDLSDLLVNG